MTDSSDQTTDYNAVMWSTLRVWANGEGDSLEAEVMAWAANEIEQLRAALREIVAGENCEPRYAPRWCVEVARRALDGQ